MGSRHVVCVVSAPKARHRTRNEASLQRSPPCLSARQRGGFKGRRRCFDVVALVLGPEVMRGGRNHADRLGELLGAVVGFLPAQSMSYSFSVRMAIGGGIFQEKRGEESPLLELLTSFAL